MLGSFSLISEDTDWVDKYIEELEKESPKKMKRKRYMVRNK